MQSLIALQIIIRLKAAQARNLLEVTSKHDATQGRLVQKLERVFQAASL